MDGSRAPMSHRGSWKKVALFGLGLAVLVPATADAQFYGRYWGGYLGYGPGWAYGPPERYEGPRPYPYPEAYGDRDEQGYPPPPEYRRTGILPPTAIQRRVASEGLRLIAPPRHNGRVYLAEAEDQHGKRHRLVFDAYDGRLIQNRPFTKAPKAVARRSVHEPIAKPRPRPLPSEATKSPIDAKPTAPPPPEPEHAHATTGVPSALQPDGPRPLAPEATKSPIDAKPAAPVKPEEPEHARASTGVPSALQSDAPPSAPPAPPAPTPVTEPSPAPLAPTAATEKPASPSVSEPAAPAPNPDPASTPTGDSQ